MLYQWAIFVLIKQTENGEIRYWRYAHVQIGEDLFVEEVGYNMLSQGNMQLKRYICYSLFFKWQWQILREKIKKGKMLYYSSQ